MSDGSASASESDAAGQPPMPPQIPTNAGSAIIQQGIANLKAHNETANAELSETLQDLREKVAAGYDTPLPSPIPDPPAGTGPDDFQYRRTVLWGSQWASEVIAAAALDQDFQDETGDKAKAILREAGMLPPEPPEEPA